MTLGSLSCYPLTHGNHYPHRSAPAGRELLSFDLHVSIDDRRFWIALTREEATRLADHLAQALGEGWKR